MASWPKKISFDILSKFRTHTPVEIAEASPTSLPRLPNELLLSIVHYLDPGDRACLSLCNRALQNKLADGCYPSLWSTEGVENQQRRSLLLRLSHDNPALLFCHCCPYLHSAAQVGLPAPHYLLTMQCTEKDSFREQPFDCFFTDGLASAYLLTFHHIQLAMIRHRHGSPYGIPLQALAWTEVQTHVPQLLEEERDGITRNSAFQSVEARIVFDRLCLRIQQIMVLSDGEKPNVRNTWSVGICTHVSTTQSRDHFSSLLQCKSLEHGGSRPAGCRTCPTVLRCRKCDIDFQLIIQDIGDSKTALILTKWVNMGQGLDPADPQWRCHLREDSPTDWRNPFEAAAEFAGPRVWFEHHEGKCQEVLTEEHIALLRDELFREAFDRQVTAWPAVGGGYLRFYQDLWFKPVQPAPKPKAVASWMRESVLSLLAKVGLKVSGSSDLA